MNKRIGLSTLFAAVVAAGLASPAAAFNGTEEDLAVPHGSFVSTMPVPAGIETVAYRPVARVSVADVNSETDLAAPQGSFVSTMSVPEMRGSRVKVASAPSEGDAVGYDELGQATLREIVAASLE